jgi:hypothetical protein
VCTVKNAWWWTEELSETRRVSFQEKIWEISASIWFYYTNLSWYTVTWTSKLILCECRISCCLAESESQESQKEHQKYPHFYRRKYFASAEDAINQGYCMHFDSAIFSKTVSLQNQSLVKWTHILQNLNRKVASPLLSFEDTVHILKTKSIYPKYTRSVGSKPLSDMSIPLSLKLFWPL